MYSDKMTSYYCLIDVCFAIFIVYNHEREKNFTFVFISTESNQTGQSKCYAQPIKNTNLSYPL